MYGEILKNLRIEKGLTQHQLAEVLGFKSASAVGMVERGERELNFESLIRVAEYFNVSSDYLMGRMPFKNETEAYHSISIAAVKYLRDDSNLSPSELKSRAEYYDLDISIFDDIDAVYLDELMTRYVNKYPLTNLELFEVSNTLFSSIRWTQDYSGLVYFEFFNSEHAPLMITFDFNKIEKITLNLNSSFLPNNEDGNTNFVRYTSVLNPMPKVINNSTHTAHIPHDAENNQDSAKKSYKDIEHIDDFEDAEHALKFILSQPVLAAYGGYDLKTMSDEEIIEIANDMLFAMRLSLEKLKRKNK
jgi:transcriptional regulator with XRE-family HTH domain